jgi:glutamate N-acetyltransferase/amino-acid N-acetyltransferase
MMPDSDRSLPRGFRFAGVACGIKKSGKRDISLIVADHGVTAAGVFTQNQIVAAPVILCKSRTPGDNIRAIVTNSGNANACTGNQGLQDAGAMCAQVAEHIDCDPNSVLVMSTGVIGVPLPMQQVNSGIAAAAEQIAADLPSFEQAADAICTTDKGRKVAYRQLRLGDQEISIAAMAKGAGMIAPNMATLLAVILTDATLLPTDAQRVIADAARLSFNRVSVDGHTSTNDTLLLLASGQGQPLSDQMLSEFADAVTDLSIELAKLLVADGEGATHVMAIQVLGASDDGVAEEVARTVAASPLVKTAITGGDPNWGRIVSAAGYAKATIDPQRTTLKICGTTIYENGSPLEFDAAALSQQMKSQLEVDIELTVGSGAGAAKFWSSDLTTEYVSFNSEYTT